MAVAVATHTSTEVEQDYGLAVINPGTPQEPEGTSDLELRSRRQSRLCFRAANHRDSTPLHAIMNNWTLVSAHYE